MLPLLAALAVASQPDPAADEVLIDLLSKAVGQPVPARYACIVRPTLPAPFRADVAIVGVQQKGRGCVRKGVAVGTRWVEPADALPAVLDADFASLSDRDDVAARWTHHGLLAFDAVDSDSLRSSTAGGSTEVRVRYHQRTDEPLVAAHVEAVFRYDAGGAVELDIQAQERWQSQLVLKPNQAKGLSTEQVSEALSAVGKLFERCFQAGWATDPAMQQRTRMTWEVDGSKATGIAVRQQSSRALSQCYANALSEATFAADGSVDFELGVRRTKLE